jgi:hypothetical protein
MGVSLARSPVVRVLTLPIVDILKSLPPQVLMLFGYFYLSPRVVGFSAPGFVTFTVFVGMNVPAFIADLVRSSITNVPREYLQHGEAFALSERQVLMQIVAPHHNTLVIFGEAVLRSYTTESERIHSALDLGSELINLGIEREWPPDLMSAGLLVLRNDVLLLGEYKRDLEGWLSLIEPRFRIEDLVQTWAPNSGGGDYLLVCRP